MKYYYEIEGKDKGMPVENSATMELNYSVDFCKTIC